jgi:TP901 family phage tail tape measure protein
MADAQRRAELIVEFKDNLSAGASAAAGSLGNLGASGKKLQDTAGAVEQQFGKLSAQLNSGSNTAVAQASIGQLDGLLKSGKISADQYGSAVGQIQLQSGLASKGSQEAADSLMNLGKQFSERKISADEFSAGVKNIQGELTATGGALDRLSSSLGITRQEMMQLALVGVTALVAALTGAVKGAAELQTTFGQISALTNTPRVAIQGLTEDVIAMSREMPISAQELAKGLYYISSSGYQGAQAMDILRASAKAAAVGLGETKTVADAVTSALNAYKLGGSDAARITDVLTQAVKEGKGEPDALAGALGRVLPIAAAAGVSFEQVAASVATMTRAGLSADESTTALRGVIGSLLAPAKQSKEALLELGLTTEDVANMLKGDGLLATLQTLMERTGGNVETLDAIIPNIRALTGVLSSAGSQGEAYAEILGKMSSAAGTTDAAFATMGDTFEFKLGKAKNAIENLGIAVGNKLLPPLSAAADAATTLINWQDKLTEAFDGTEAKIKASAKTYEEYQSATIATGRAAGLVTSMFVVGTGTVTKYADAFHMLTQAQWEVARGMDYMDAGARGLSDKLTVVTKTNQTAGVQAIKTADQLKEEAKALKEVQSQAADAAIANSKFVESLTTKLGGVKFDALTGAKSTIDSLEQSMRADPANKDKYAAQLRALKSEFGLISPPAEAAADAFSRLESIWKTGAITTTSYAKALGNIQKAAADGKVGVDELGLKTGEAAAYMTTSAANAKTSQDAIVDDARSAKQRMLDEMGNALGEQQTKLQGKISDSMLSVANSMSTAKSLANTTADDIGKAWARVPTDVTTTYHINVEGSVPSGGTSAPSGTGKGHAAGGIIAGAMGFIAQSPTYLVGEGGYNTFAGRGAEGVIPLNDRGINILAEALGRAMERMPASTTNVYASPGVDIITKVSQGLAAQARQAKRAGAGAMGR